MPRTILFGTCSECRIWKIQRCWLVGGCRHRRLMRKRKCSKLTNPPISKLKLWLCIKHSDQCHNCFFDNLKKKTSLTKKTAHMTDRIRQGCKQMIFFYCFVTRTDMSHLKHFFCKSDYFFFFTYFLPYHFIFCTYSTAEF
jgi:hypothetical protein